MALAAPASAAALVGVLTATQARVVGDYQSLVSNALQLVLVNYAIGIAALSLLVISRAKPRQALRALPQAVKSRRVRWFQCTGGVLGAWLVVSQALTVPRIGVAQSVVSVVCGMLVAGVVVDAFGLGPAGRQSPTRMRIFGAALGLVAVAVDVAPALIAHGMASEVIYSLLSFTAGCGVAVQQAFNGRVAAATGQALVSGWLNFMTGAIALGLVTVGLAVSGVTPLVDLPSTPWWIYTPGFIGAAFVSLAAWAVGAIGVLRLGLLSVAGQLTAAVIFDFFSPMAGLAMELRGITAAIIAFLAVFVSSRGSLRGTTNP